MPVFCGIIGHLFCWLVSLLVVNRSYSWWIFCFIDLSYNTCIGIIKNYTFVDCNIIYLIMGNKSSLHAPFVFHASLAWGFHFDFFNTCFVTLGSPGCKQDLFHLIFTTASVSVCLTSSTTFPWHHTYVGSHSSSIHSHNMSIPHGDDFNLLPLKIFQPNCCISLGRATGFILFLVY